LTLGDELLRTWASKSALITLLITGGVLLLGEYYETRNTAFIAQECQHLGLYSTGQQGQWIMNGKGCERTCQCHCLSF